MKQIFLDAKNVCKISWPKLTSKLLYDLDWDLNQETLKTIVKHIFG